MSDPFFRNTVTVNPTSTSLAIVSIANTRLMAISVKNLDAAQSLTVTLRRRAHPSDDFADAAAFQEFDAIPPLTARSVDVDCGTHFELEVVGVASGAGLQATLACKPDMGRRP